METILRMVERKYGKARRIWVFDRGIVSEENLQPRRRISGGYAAQPDETVRRRTAEGRLDTGPAGSGSEEGGPFRRVRRPISCVARQAGRKKRKPSGTGFPPAWKTL